MEPEKKLNHIADIPLRLFEGAPEGYRVVGASDDEGEDRIVIVFELSEAA